LQILKAQRIAVNLLRDAPANAFDLDLVPRLIALTSHLLGEPPHNRPRELCLDLGIDVLAMEAIRLELES
jgi:hypothetical protein